MKHIPSICALSPIRTSQPEKDWDLLCRAKDLLWAKNKQVLRVQPKPTDKVSDPEFEVLMKMSLNEVLASDAVIVFPEHEMCPDVHLRCEVARAIGVEVIRFDENGASRLADLL